jgi:DNA-directed RNA polymerase specialized sigma24 family protein
METKKEPFDEFLALLEPDYPNSDQRYKQFRLKLVKFFSWRHCEDSHGLADETISRLMKNVLRGEEIHSNKPYNYVYATASNVFREYRRGKMKDQALASDLLSSTPIPLHESQDCRKKCLHALSNDKISLLEQYYFSEKDKEKLARSMGTTLNGLRLQIHRIKKELKACYENCINQKS